MERARAGRLGALDGLRGLAATGVVLLHTWMFNRGDVEGESRRLADPFLREMRLGVMLFFVLSGYLLYRPWVRAALDGRVTPKLSVYAARRAARILPAYWLALAGAYVLTTAIGHPLARDADQLWIYALLLQNYSAGAANGFDPPMWSLVVEVSFYAALPLLAWGAIAVTVRGRRGAQLAVCLLLVVAGTALNTVAHLEGWPRTLTSSLPFFLQYFGVGMAVAVVVHRRTWSARTGVLLLLLGVALIAFNGWWHIHAGYPLRHELKDLPAGIGFGLIVAALVAAPLKARLLTCAPVALLGTLSYGIYLWHFPALVLLRDRGWWPDTLVPQFAAVLGLSAAVAAVSWLALERPILAWVHRRTGG